MSVKSSAEPDPADGMSEPSEVSGTVICPCQGITLEQVRERIRQGRLNSVEAVQGITHIGEGRCHGQICGESFRRLLMSEGIVSAESWIDWRFPWAEWVVTPSPST